MERTGIARGAHERAVAFSQDLSVFLPDPVETFLGQLRLNRPVGN